MNGLTSNLLIENRTLKSEVNSLRQQLTDQGEYYKEVMKDGDKRIVSLSQQLAAALAACKLKDAALENVEGMLDELRVYPVTHDEIIEALAIQPDDTALKAWLGEPVAWADTYGNVIRNSTKEFSRNAMTNAFSVPLYSPKLLK